MTLRRRFSGALWPFAKVLAFAAVVHFFVIPQIGGARSALDAIGSLNPWLIGLAAVLEGLALLVYAWLTVLLLPPEDRPTLPVAFGTVMASTGINHVVPGGAATTVAVNFRLLGHAGVRREPLGIALGTQAVGSAVVLNVMLWCALVISIPTSGFHPIYASAAAVGAVLMALVGGAVLGLRRGRERFADRMASSIGRVPFLKQASVRSIIGQASRQVDELLDDRGRFAMVVTLAALNWLFDAAALFVTLTAFGSVPGLNGLLVAYCLANVMAAIPISPGGLGVVEAIMIPTLIGFGVPTSVASVGVVAYRLISFWAPIPLGAMSYLLVERASGRRGSFVEQIERTAAAADPGVASLGQHL